MKINKTYWKGDYIYPLPTITICIDKDRNINEKSIYIKLSFLKYNLGLIIICKDLK